jgi:hypothetical protein
LVPVTRAPFARIWCLLPQHHSRAFGACHQSTIRAYRMARTHGTAQAFFSSIVSSLNTARTLNVSPPPSRADAASAESDDAMNTAGAAALKHATHVVPRRDTSHTSSAREAAQIVRLRLRHRAFLHAYAMLMKKECLWMSEMCKDLLAPLHVREGEK